MKIFVSFNFTVVNTLQTQDQRPYEKTINIWKYIKWNLSEVLVGEFITYKIDLILINLFNLKLWLKAITLKYLLLNEILYLKFHLQGTAVGCSTENEGLEEIHSSWWQGTSKFIVYKSFSIQWWSDLLEDTIVVIQCKFIVTHWCLLELHLYQFKFS